MIEPKNCQTQKNIRTSRAVNDVDWPGLRAAAVTIGIRAAARQAGRDLPPDEQERLLRSCLGLTEPQCRDYLRHNLNFRLEPGEQQGLELFLRHAAELGLAPSDVDLGINHCKTAG